MIALYGGLTGLNLHWYLVGSQGLGEPWSSAWEGAVVLAPMLYRLRAVRQCWLAATHAAIGRMGIGMKNTGKRIFATVLLAALASLPFLAAAGLHYSQR